ncbi:nitroreductase family protein [Thiomonas intermedia]|uniref:nitroreductase family protein n=1 Tax=Thiomonas intermedia TaxID=926 RepID=UPI0009A48158|nr:nitroreductase [Thiomonas intermedia]
MDPEPEVSAHSPTQAQATVAAVATATQVSEAGIVAALLRRRQQVSPKRLREPGPDAEQTRALFDAAAQAPDHGLILPWRFVVVPTSARGLLGDAFAQALFDRDPNATEMQLQDARDKAFRGPFLALAIARLHDEHPEIPPAERLVSLGCALQNVLLQAQAQGFGAGLVSGLALNSEPLRRLFMLDDAEQAVCFVLVGTPLSSKTQRKRPTPESFVSKLHVSPTSATLVQVPAP